MKATTVVHSNHTLDSRDDSLEYQAEHALRKVLQDVPFIRTVEVDHRSPEHPFDFIARVDVGGKTHNIVVDTASNGQPRNAKAKIAGFTAWHLRKELHNGYFVFAAPFVSDTSRELCKEAGIGFLDLTGNCFMSFNNVYIERFGFQKEAEKRELRSIFHEKASRVVRRLLTYPQHAWHVQELAKKAGVSTGLVSQVKSKLLDSELAERRGDMFVVTRPVDLLKRWGEAYRFDKSEQAEYYSSKSLADVDRQLSEYCQGADIDYSFTLFAGAKAIGSQYVRIANRSHAYVLAPLESLARDLELKPVPSGGNVVLIKPFDADLLFGKRPINDAWIVSDIQLYLDFTAQKGRAQETAEFLLDSRIRKVLENDLRVSDSQ